MPQIYYLNPPPNPFWNFVSDMQEHAFFDRRAGHRRPEQQEENTQDPAGETSATNEKQQQSAGAEDPPEADPSTLRREGEKSEMPFRGRFRRGSSSDEEGCGRRRECGGRRGFRGRGGHHGFPGGPGPFGQGGFPFGPFWARGAHAAPPPPPEAFGPEGLAGPHGPHGRHEHHGPGPWGRGGRFRGGPGGPGGPHHGPHHRHGHGHRGPSPPGGGPGAFRFQQFLNNLGARFGVDLSGMAEGMNMGHSNPDVDFEPKADIFDREQDYIIHLSLPGAKKSDLGVDWDGEHSVLRVAGVVHRPNVDERMLEQLIVDGRKRETGVFEKNIKLGTRQEPALVEVSGITAKMTDGVLVIVVPKSERHHEKRDVPITKSATPSPARDNKNNNSNTTNEKYVYFASNADREMHDADTDSGEIQMIDRTEFDNSSAKKNNAAVAAGATSSSSAGTVTARGKQAGHERQSRESSATVRGPTTSVEPEPLPAYRPSEHTSAAASTAMADDWETFGSDEEGEGEGEFIKINVD